MATTEIVAVEVVRALCGSVGLIAAVPLTTVLAALVVTEEAPELILAAYDDPELDREAIAVGAYAFLIKGCQMQLICQLTDQAWAHARTLAVAPPFTHTRAPCGPGAVPHRRPSRASPEG